VEFGKASESNVSSSLPAVNINCFDSSTVEIVRTLPWKYTNTKGTHTFLEMFQCLW